MFREVHPFRGFGLSVDLPALASLDAWAAALAGGSAVALFWLKAGMLPTLLASCAAGMLLYYAGALG
jgi:chromate transporter